MEQAVVQHAALTSTLTSACGCSIRRAKDGNSYCRTSTSRRENVICRIDVAMMTCARLEAGPLSYSKSFRALRARAPFTASTVNICYLRSVRIADEIAPHFPTSALESLCSWSFRASFFLCMKHPYARFPPSALRLRTRVLAR